MKIVTGRVSWVDYAKGISILLVVIHHSMFRDANSSMYNEYILFINDLMQNMRMPLFFFVSGIFIHSALKKKFGDFFKFKVIHLLYIYVLWSVIRYLMSNVPEHLLSGGSSGDLFSILKIFYQPPGTLWFIYALAIFIFVTRTVQKKPYLALSISIMLFLLASFYNPGGFFFEKVLTYYPYYLLGFILSKKTIKQAAKVHAGYISLPVIFFTIITTLNIFNLNDGRPTFLLVSCGGIISGIVLAVFLSKLSIFSWVQYVGQNTLPIYLMHFFPVGVLRAILPNVIPGQTLLAVSIMVISAVTLPLIVMKITKKLGMYWLYSLPKRFKSTNEPQINTNAS
jgi:uncharacterized membrane protein YcfT